MKKKEIASAISQAREGIYKYLTIMGMFHTVDVSIDRNFQRQFNAFYRIRQRPERWYSEYYSFMESRKRASVRFEDVLDHMNIVLKRYEPSFSSKLAATLDPNEPVWDKYVLQNTGQKAPYYSARDKVEKAKNVFEKIREWYKKHMQSPEGKMMVEVFNDMIKEHEKITDLKKVDFVLWKTRS
jgi:hypothetical protein